MSSKIHKRSWALALAAIIATPAFFMLTVALVIVSAEIMALSTLFVDITPTATRAFQDNQREVIKNLYLWPILALGFIWIYPTILDWLVSFIPLGDTPTESFQLSLAQFIKYALWILVVNSMMYAVVYIMLVVFPTTKTDVNLGWYLAPIVVACILVAAATKALNLPTTLLVPVIYTFTGILIVFPVMLWVFPGITTWIQTLTNTNRVLAPSEEIPKWKYLATGILVIITAYFLGNAWRSRARMTKGAAAWALGSVTALFMLPEIYDQVETIVETIIVASEYVIEALGDSETRLKIIGCGVAFGLSILIYREWIKK